MLAQSRDGFGETAYERHQSEQTLLYQIVEAHYPAHIGQLSQQDKSLPDHVHREFEAYLTCGRLEHGFLKVRLIVLRHCSKDYRCLNSPDACKKLNPVNRCAIKEIGGKVNGY